MCGIGVFISVSFGSAKEKTPLLISNHEKQTLLPLFSQMLHSLSFLPSFCSSVHCIKPTQKHNQIITHCQNWYTLQHWFIAHNSSSCTRRDVHQKLHFPLTASFNIAFLLILPIIGFSIAAFFFLLPIKRIGMEMNLLVTYHTMKWENV